MRSLTDEAKEIVREFMADGKVATRKMVAEQVEKNISRPNEYRVNILNGVIKVLTENHELDVVERGKYQLGKGLAKKTHEELALMYLMNCKENMGSLCSIEGTDTSEDKKKFIMKVTDTIIEVDKLIVRFNGGVKPVEVEKKADTKVVEPVKKAEPEKAEKKDVAKVEKKDPAKAEKKEVAKTEKKEDKPVEKKEAPKAEKELAKAEKKEVKPVEKAVTPKAEKKAEPAKKEEKVVKKEVDKEVKAEKAEAAKAEPKKAEMLPAVVKKEEAPKTEQKAVEKKEVPAK